MSVLPVLALGSNCWIYTSPGAIRPHQHCSRSASATSFNTAYGSGRSPGRRIDVNGTHRHTTKKPDHPAGLLII
jgi:hypothetical protein